MNTRFCPPAENTVLTALSAATAAELIAQSERIALRDGEVLYRPAQPGRYAFFPSSALVSLEFHDSGGAMAELAVVGRDGLVGVPALLGVRPTHHAVVQSSGIALRVRIEVLQRRVRDDPAVREVIDSYTHQLLAQVAQTSACKSLHPLSKRLCRWLLVCADRLNTVEVRVTQDQLARLLGVRRESVNHATSLLQASGCLRIGRGHVRIVDAARLEESACECLSLIRDAHAGRLTPVPAPLSYF